MLTTIKAYAFSGATMQSLYVKGCCCTLKLQSNLAVSPLHTDARRAGLASDRACARVLIMHMCRMSAGRSYLIGNHALATIEANAFNGLVVGTLYVAEFLAARMRSRCTLRQR